MEDQTHHHTPVSPPSGGGVGGIGNTTMISNTSNQPGANDQHINRRKRKALSCYDCRRRKLKCDRVFPACGRCVKGNIAETCSYDLQGNEDEEEGQDDREHDEPSRSTGSGPKPLPPRHSDRSVEQTRRIQYLEQKLARMEAQMDFVGVPALRATPEIAVRPNMVFQAEGDGMAFGGSGKSETMFVRGKGFKTQYYGSTKAAALVSQLPELQNLMHSAFTHVPHIAKARKDFKTLKKKAKEDASGQLADPNSTKLLDHLPEKHIVDLHVQTYFNTLDTVYRIIHRPSFSREYEDFWQNPSGGKDEFVAILLLILATIRCECVKPGTYIHDSSTARERAIAYTRACDNWLDKQSHKHISLSIFQVHYLSMLSKMINNIKEKRTWMNTGALLRLGMTTGLHRDPKKLAPKRYGLTQSGHRDHPKHRVVMSLHEEELRRRFWATAVEWELQASIERGMFAMTAGCPFDTEPPMNILDEELDDSSEELPQPRPDDHFTPNFYLHHSHRSLKFRIMLNSTLNDPGSQLTFDDVLKYETKIMQELNAIPTPKRPETMVDTDGSVVDAESFDKKTIVARALLDIQLRHFITMLHVPFVQKFQYSAVSSINAACRILNWHEKLHAAGIHTISILRNDLFRSSLAVCHHLMMSNTLQSDFLLSSIASPAADMMSKALSMMEDQSHRLGTGLREYWVVTCANALVQAKGNPGKLDKLIQQAVDAIKHVMGRIINSQEISYATPVSGTSELSPSNPVMQMPQNFLPNATFDMTFPSGDIQIAPFDPGNFNDWTFDDFWQFDSFGL